MLDITAIRNKQGLEQTNLIIPILRNCK